MKKDEKNKKKRAYKKPSLKVIELATGETLAVGCKTAGGSAALSAPPCWSNSCNTDGS